MLRGKKLVLKDGTFQLVRDYQRNGERVRYLSAERGDWEEIPAAMVDWDATAKVAAEEKSEEDALAKKIRAQEQAQKIETFMDVDASLQVAPGVFLPPGEGIRQSAGAWADAGEEFNAWLDEMQRSRQKDRPELP